MQQTYRKAQTLINCTENSTNRQKLNALQQTKDEGKRENPGQKGYKEDRSLWS